MVSAADKLSPTRFGSLTFPSQVTELEIVNRYHTHEYSHVPGGANEKLGRGLVQVTIEASFEDKFKAYPNLYPDGVNLVRGFALAMTTLPFTHPQAGQFPAFITRYRQRKESKLLSGERLSLTLIEDQATQFALSNVSASTNSGLDPAAQSLVTSAASVRAQLQFTPNDLNLFAAISDSVNAIIGLRDGANLIGSRYVAAVGHLLDQCAELDRSMSIQDARAFPVLQALRQLQYQTLQILSDIQSKQFALSVWTVPQTMTSLQIAANVYRDASRSGDVLSLNPQIENPLRVPAGTRVRYYPPTAQAA